MNARANSRKAVVIRSANGVDPVANKEEESRVPNRRSAIK
jgi:hypothetical protein